MKTAVKHEKARLEFKCSKEQKELFELATSLGGYRTVTEFIINTVMEKASNIVKAQDTFLASQRDKEIFFHALLNPGEPNEELKKAASIYNALIKEE
jgi:uncharacterized protein (DUF1778 family)